MASKVALFVDRDGVLIEDRVDYARTWDDVVILEPAIEALRLATEAGLPIIVITNQSSVGKGILTLEQVTTLNDEILNYFRDRGAKIVDAFMCPHAPNDGCACRKPKPGMLIDAAEKHEIDLAKSFFIGDARRDMEAATAAGTQGLFVQTGQGPQHFAKMTDDEKANWPAFDNILSVVQFVLAR